MISAVSRRIWSRGTFAAALVVVLELASALCFSPSAAAQAIAPGAPAPAAAPAAASAPTGGYAPAVSSRAGAQIVSLSVPERVRRGDAFSVAVTPGRIVASVNVELVSPRGTTVLSVPAFPVTTVRDVPVMVAILALDSTALVGTYHVHASVTLVPEAAELAQVRGLALDSTLPVVDRDFVHEDIRLDSALSDLREVPDPRQEAEAREILAILAKFDPTADFADGTFELPLESFRETSHFGDRRRYLYADGNTAASIHYGLDLAAPIGTPVHAAAAGRIVFAGPRIISGNTIVIEHMPGVYDLYYHMSAILAKAGDMVSAGQEIGKVGMTGLATGPHLHWEIRVDGVPVEPKRFLDGPIIDKAALFATIVHTNESAQQGR